MPQRSLADLRLSSRPLLAVLEGIEKPGNVGAIVRSADAAGIDAVVVADGGTDLFNPNAIRASLGTLFTCPVCVERTQRAQEWLAQLGVQVCVARLDASRGYDDVDYRLPTAFVLGSEAQGVSAHWARSSYAAIKLPMFGVADSLNVAATAAVLFYEARRQRRYRPEKS
jgi:TrmH family RNA methyltransferase